MSEVKIKLAAGTNAGLIRQNNEDNFVVSCDLGTSEWLIPQTSEYTDLGEYGALLVVADGMGGANAGEVASAIAIETIQTLFVPERLQNKVDNDKDRQEFMRMVVKQADLNILQHSKEDIATQGMGTTIVMAWIVGEKAYICWCGDSRCYVLNKRYGLVRLSKDHSYVQELVDKGELNPEFANDHPLSNVITRCLGDIENRADPETKIYQLHDGDTIMLCSDGLCGLCNDDEILHTMVESQEDLMRCKNELISFALSNGGYDNVTVALCNIQKEGEDEMIEGFTDDEKCDQESQETEGEEDLSATIRCETTRRRKKHPVLKLILLLLLTIGGIAAYLYFFQDELWQETFAAVIPYVVKIKSLVQ